MEMEKEFEQMDKAGNWVAIYQDIGHEASDFPCRVAKLPKNKTKTGTKKSVPGKEETMIGHLTLVPRAMLEKTGFHLWKPQVDHSWIELHQDKNDYIKASLLKMEKAQRS